MYIAALTWLIFFAGFWICALINVTHKGLAEDITAKEFVIAVAIAILAITSIIVTCAAYVEVSHHKGQYETKH
jgi:ABC-type uncharacterized transport system permease subunit